MRERIDTAACAADVLAAVSSGGGGPDGENIVRALEVCARLAQACTRGALASPHAAVGGGGPRTCGRNMLLPLSAHQVLTELADVAGEEAAALAPAADLLAARARFLSEAQARLLRTGTGPGHHVCGA